MNDTTQLVERRCSQCRAAILPGFAFCSRCGASVERGATAPPPLLEDLAKLLGADYTLEREVGQGAMATVYAAWDVALDRRVAVKVLLPEFASDPVMAERFRREARTVAALQHANVVSVYGLRSSGEINAILMQYVDGRSVDALTQLGGKLPLHVVGLILSQVAAGLQHAHDHGVVHRDVKPANVLIDPEGRAVVSDFGIARRDNLAPTTGSGVILGTPAYISPECALGERGDARSDQYSFGVMAFELLSGRLPFAAASAPLMLNAHIRASPPRLRSLCPDVPPTIEAYVMRALEKDPAARHPHLRDAERLFRTLVPDASNATTELMRISGPRLPRGPITADRRSMAARPGGTKRRPVPVGAAIGIGAGLIAAALLLMRCSR